MITHEQIMFALAQAYPDLKYNVDYRTGHPVDPKNPFAQTGDAFILGWTNKDIAQPSAVVVAGLVKVHEAKFTQAQQASAARVQRNKLLCEADVLFNAAHIANKQKDNDYILALRKYRQLLRDVPKQASFPASVTWPTLPEQA